MRRRKTNLKWPPVLMKDFVNLLCIESRKNQDEETTKLIVHGDIDKVEETRTPIHLSDLAPKKDGVMPSCILVQGAPGSGKTMFSWEVVERWTQGNLLQDYPLVVMLPLRDPDIQNASRLEDLFPHDHKPFQREVSTAVEREAGKGVLLLLDGFDELPADKKKESSFWMKLIRGEVLQLATVMITSQSWATKTLLEPNHCQHISQHIEIVGFTRKNVNEYISKAFPDAAEESKFRQYLYNYPHIRSAMYVPLNCAIMVEVYRSSGATNSAPKTMTEVYTALVMTLMQRYLKDHPKGPWLGVSQSVRGLFRAKRIFRDFPSNVYQQLCNISRLAYQGLCNNQQLIFSNLPAHFETLGLLQRVPQLHNERKASVSYNFLHLTVQEFLAAFHILLQGPRQQRKHMRGDIPFKRPTSEETAEGSGQHGSLSDDDSDMEEEDVREGSCEVVCKFLAGLGGQFKAKLSDYVQGWDLIFLHRLFESQNESLASSLLGKENSTKTVNLSWPSPHDMYVLGYCISLSNCQWEVELIGLGDEPVEMMSRGISSWGQGKLEVAGP